MYAIKKVYFWFIALFKTHDVEVVKPKRKYKKKEKLDEYVDWDFKDLLDGLDAVFSNIDDPDIVSHNLSTTETRALKKLGPHIVSPSFRPEKIKYYLNNMPALMYVHIKPEEYDHISKDPKLPLTAVFAIKIDKLPWCVQPINGVHYECGICMKLIEKKRKRNAWMQAYITIKQDQSLECNLILRDTMVHGVNYRNWKLPIMCDEDTTQKNKEAIEFIFRHTYAWWINRERFWHVRASKGKRHCTFAIPINDAPRFFKDRDLAILKKDGTRKAVMHFVASHLRHYRSGKIKPVITHMRGLRNFNWNNYELEINHPGHKKPSSSSFTAGGDQDDNLKDNGEYISLEEVVDHIGSLTT